MHIDLYLCGVLLLLLHGSLLPGAAAVPVCVPLQQLQLRLTQVVSCVAKPEPLRLNLRKAKKKSLVLKTCMKSILRTNMNQKNVMSRAGAAWNRPFCVESAPIPSGRSWSGSRTSDVRSRPKKWRLRNTIRRKKEKNFSAPEPLRQSQN